MGGEAIQAPKKTRNPSTPGRLETQAASIGTIVKPQQVKYLHKGTET